MASFAPVEEQLATLLRGVVDVKVESELRDKLTRSARDGRPLIVKAGFDPTAPDLHLGHTVLLHKMRQFQRLGHQVVFLIGDFTALIGDPTGRSATRPALTPEEVQKNAVTYKEQVFKVLDPERTVIRFNSEWLQPLTFADIIRLCGQVTVAQMLEREDFKTRLAEQRPLSLHEILYPLSQAYDSVALKADVELGGKDQLFNLMLGRDLMRTRGMEPQVILTGPILEGTDADPGGRKMSKSYGNYVGVSEPPDAQVLKLMGISDALMWRYYELLSDLSTAEIAALRARVEGGQEHPRAAKLALCRELVTRFHGAPGATAALEAYEGLARGDALPPDAPVKTVHVPDGGIAPAQLVVELGFARSKREAGERIRQGALRWRTGDSGEFKAADERTPMEWAAGTELQVRYGKRDYARVRRG
ncbi:MAG: tyrosine--tRNA ligase [Deltaproteobacteria bacterium]|nr:tyrosine--tRNA ligase [Deltaproteobacteria bacterium]